MLDKPSTGLLGSYSLPYSPQTLRVCESWEASPFQGLTGARKQSASSASSSEVDDDGRNGGKNRKQGTTARPCLCRGRKHHESSHPVAASWTGTMFFRGLGYVV